MSGDTLTKKYTLREAREQRRMSRQQLVDSSGISMTCINEIEGDGRFATNIDVATKLAAALRLEVEDIVWPRGLSHLGRPPGTGRAISAQPEPPATCTKCWTVKSAAGTCAC